MLFARRPLSPASVGMDLVDDVPSETKLLLTVSEAASVLGISRSVVYELLLAGKIRSIKIGRSRRIPFAVLEEFVTHCLAEQHTVLQGR
jgi:excisionase family DNA binding protein